MNYISTRGLTRPHSFSEAVEAGLAPDAGLFLPEKLPSINDKLSTWSHLSYPKLAAEFLSIFAPEIPLSEWHELTAQAYSRFAYRAVAPMYQLDDKTYILELFHGPTLAFKDFALQLLGLLYKRQVNLSGKRLAVLGATSGDTGSAAIHGCMGQDGIRIFILYPDGRVSPLQERQMACTGAENVFAIPVPGTFDDAQRVVKSIFADTEYASSINLSAVNSINIARILAQCVYYIWAWLRLPPAAQENCEFVVPTGNFGNVLAGWLAAKMGLPIKSFCVATNQNDILYRFFTTGSYQQSDVHPSHAPSMDIQAASNFERYLYYLWQENPEAVRDGMAQLLSGKSMQVPEALGQIRATRMDDAEIASTIASVWRRFEYVVDPHTACAFKDLSSDKISVILATASPAKFPDLVTEATGTEPTDPSLEALKSLDLQRWPLPATDEAVKAFIKAHV